jgi:predicted regulator of Ras-like GTPase activity (Roadblock/LC7/MglB family)
VNPEGSGTLRTEVLAELHRLREDLADVDGSLVATTDGMVIAHALGRSESYGVQPESVAALAAVSMGLSQRITDSANHGDLHDLSIRGSLGQVVSFPAGDRALLTIIVRSTGDLTPIQARAERVVRRLIELLDDNWQDDAATWTSAPTLAPGAAPPLTYRNSPTFD